MKTLNARTVGKKEMVFEGITTTDDFCTWLFSEENSGATVICHNFQGYDSYPILQYLYKNGIVPKLIPNGSKIMSLEVANCKIRMIDSLNFLPMPLSKLPKTFGFTEMAKGYFPHLFNKQKNQDIVLIHLPDIRYYNPNGMKSEDRVKFMDWYEEHKDDLFDFKHELLKYCRSDVDILRRCVLKFREIFMSVTARKGKEGIDPFQECITIASACNLVFRNNFLTPETIGIIPAHGYRPTEKQSIKALQWIKYLAHKDGIYIQHARNGGEKSIGPYKVDGYYECESGEKVVLEFHGDFWHGNLKAYAKTTVNPVNGLTMGELYERTLDKKRYLEKEGYTYVCKWEKDFDREVEENSELKAFISEMDIVTPLEPRDAFAGGRTEAFTLFKKLLKT